MDHPDDSRRGFLERALGRIARKVADVTEEKVVQRRYVRPPGAIPEMAFLAACTRCDACAVACPVGAIMRVSSRGGLAAGTPYLEPGRSPCIACAEMPCAAACPTDALSVPTDMWQDQRFGTIVFHPERCVTFEGRPCGVCVRACPVGETALSLDDEGRPILKAEGCVACGVCVRDCITMPSSFTFHPLTN
jgi:ferredoxin-type protein NapG